MAVIFSEEQKVFILETKNLSYMIKTDHLGHLEHLYFGPKTGAEDLSASFPHREHAFSGTPYEISSDHAYSLDFIPQEYTSYGIGDYRVNSIAISHADGSCCADFKYVSHSVTDGKYDLEGLPCVYDEDGSSKTLIIRLNDPVSNVNIELYYAVLEDLDVITRSAKIINEGQSAVVLHKASSICLDLPYGKWDLIHFHGRHCMENQVERIPLFHGIQTISSVRGMSSHQHNPFVIISEHDATEDHGICYGCMLMYSGNHKTEIELDQLDSVRVVTGIHDDFFDWQLLPGESFVTPEVILSCADGLTQLSHNYHKTIRHHVVRGRYKLSHRPILVNSWEAAYFDVNKEKLLALADKAREIGAELFVLDDGWFKNRNDDYAALGDWTEDPYKFPDGLDGLITEIENRGLLFGLWIEPEMVNENSDLFRAHPDWVLSAPGRKPSITRNQMVLDLSREDVYEYLYKTISGLLKKHSISYIKWDFNRCQSDIYSHVLPAHLQGKTAHLYYLNLYRLYDNLTKEFPDVLFEGCSGGGGRFDAGMLCYSPQIWCSDDTDPISRLSIQYGKSFGYPMSTIGAHVSASPNHQSGRHTPLSVRAAVAMSGVFGYELDLTRLSQSELDEIRDQIVFYRKIEPLIHDGLYYRLNEAGKDRYQTWQIVSPDGEKSILSIVITNPVPNAASIHVRLKGLIPDAVYDVNGEYTRSGLSLMTGGYTFRFMFGDYSSAQILLTKIN